MSAITRWVSPSEAADHYGLSTRTLARMRADGTGPAWERIGRSIRYPLLIIPAMLRVLSTAGPIGYPGDVLPDADTIWRTIHTVERLEPADAAASPAWLTTLRPATDAERARVLSGLERLMAEIRLQGAPNV